LKQEAAILGVAPAKSTGAFFNEFAKTSSKQNHVSHSGKQAAGGRKGTQKLQKMRYIWCCHILGTALKF